MSKGKHIADQSATAHHLLSNLPVIRVYVPSAFGFGDQVNAYNAVQRCLALGYNNTFEIVYEQYTVSEVATLFGVSESKLMTNPVLQSWHPQIRLVQYQALLKFPHLFEQVPVTISGSMRRSVINTLKTDVYIVPSNNGIFDITSGTGEDIIKDYRDKKIGSSIVITPPSMKAITNMLSKSDYGKALELTAPGLLAIMDGVSQGNINTQVAYGMHWSFFSLARGDILAKISTAACIIKHEQPRLKKPTLVLVLNQFSSWRWWLIRSTLSRVLSQDTVGDLSYLADKLRICSIANRTLPILTPGTELVEYLATASPSSIALVKMPPLHPDLYAYLVDQSPFPYLFEGLSSKTLLGNFGKHGIQSHYISDPITPFSDIVGKFQNLLDKESQSFQQWYLKPENDMILNALALTAQYVQFPNNRHETLRLLPAPQLNQQILRLHYADYLYSAMLPASVISCCNTLYKRKSTTYTQAAFIKWSLLVADGYLNSRLTANAFLIATDMLLELGFEEEITLVVAIPILHNVVNWVLNYPASIPEVKQRVFEVGTSFVGAVVGNVCGSFVASVGSNCASWFYRPRQGYAPNNDQALLPAAVIPNKKNI